MEMMSLAEGEYSRAKLEGLVQCDITTPPFSDGCFECIVVLGLMHRVPSQTMEKALRALRNCCHKHMIVSYSIDSAPQRLKRWLLRLLLPDHKPAPAPLPIREIMGIALKTGLTPIRQFTVVPFLSSEIIVLFTKNIESDDLRN